MSHGLRQYICHGIIAACAISLGAPAAYAQTHDTVSADLFEARLLRARVELPHDSVEVPLEKDTIDMPTVRVMINGRGPFYLGIETGSSHTIVTPTLAQLLGPLPKTAGIVSKTGEQFVTIDSIGVGTARFENIPVVVRDFGRIPGLDGLLALNAFYDVLLTVDDARHRVRFTRGALPPVNGKEILPLHPLRNMESGVTMWYGIDVGVDGKSVDALFDTRHDGALWAIPALVADSQFEHAPVFKGYGPYGSSQPWRLGRWNGNWSLAGTTFQHPMVDVEPRPASYQGWIIGWRALRHFAITLDQRNSRVQLTPTTAVVVPPPPYMGFVSINLNFSDGTITSVEPVAIAEQQGLKNGDVIVEVDHVPAPELIRGNWEAFANALDGNGPIHLVVRRGTETHGVTMAKVPLVP